jgi:uncharacterized damage-inducible protein DinB
MIFKEKQMFRTVADIETTWKSVSETTLKMMQALTDESLNQSVSDGHRTLGRIAWHIAMSLPEMAVKMGMDFSGFDYEQPVPNTAKEIADTYAKLSSTITERAKLDLTDTGMTEELEMYGAKMLRGAWLQVMINHEIHHRGQLTVLMRQAGLIVPGLYGPAKEEWANYGMEVPEV